MSALADRLTNAKPHLFTPAELVTAQVNGCRANEAVQDRRHAPATEPSAGPGPASEDLRFRLNRFDSQLRLEFELISHRMGWLVTSQSFLFTAFAITLTIGKPEMFAPGQLLRTVVCIVGLLTASSIYMSLLAAHQVIRQCKRQRDVLEAHATRFFGYEPLGVPAASSLHVLGGVPSHTMPVLILGVWTFLLFKFGIL